MQTTQQRSQLGAAAVILFLDLMILIAMLFAPQAKVINAAYQVTALPPGQVPQPGGEPGLPGLPFAPALVATFTIELDSRLIGQSIRFKEVVFSDQNGKDLGSIEVTQVSRQVKTIVTDDSGNTQEFPQPETVDGELNLYPFEGTTVTIWITSEKDLGIQAGQTVKARIRGRSSLRPFSIETDIKPIAPTPPPPG